MSNSGFFKRPLIMYAHSLSITDLYSSLEKAANKEVAEVISRAFEQQALDQKQLLLQNKQETLQEMHPQELATKGDLTVHSQELQSKIVQVTNELKTEIALVRSEFKAELTEVRNEFKAEIAEVRNEFKAELTEVRNELKAEIAEVRNELKAEITQVRNELKTEIAAVRSELKADIAALRDEWKEDITKTNNRITQLEVKMLQVVSVAKWQVIGSIAVLLFMQVIVKHFGF